MNIKENCYAAMVNTGKEQYLCSNPECNKCNTFQINDTSDEELSKGTLHLECVNCHKEYKVSKIKDITLIKKGKQEAGIVAKFSSKKFLELKQK